MADTVAALTPKTAHPSSDRLRAADLTNFLPAGVTIATADSFTQVNDSGAAGLTITDLAVNTATFLNDDGTTVAIGAGIQMNVAGGVASVTYLITVLFTLTGGAKDAVVLELRMRDA